MKRSNRTIESPAAFASGEKSWARRFLERTLLFMARRVLSRYQPIVVGVTGSVGKSSTKEAIALVLSKGFTVRKAEGNYNNEIGIPLTVLGVKSGGHSLIRWLSVVLRFIRLMLLPNRYPQVLVLELGIDRPGDMTYLLSFVPVTIGVFTMVGTSHIAHFGSVGNIAKEKGKLIASLPEDGFAILNADDERVMRFAKKTKAKVMTFGFGEGAAVRGEHIKIQREVRLVEGLSFKLAFAGTNIPVRLPHVVAPHHVPAVLAAVAVGAALKLNPVDIADALSAFEPLPGRLRLLPGVNSSFLLDDTYNASPPSTRAALHVLKELAAARKIVVLGDMLELGENATSAHRDLAPHVTESGASLAILVGRHMRSLADALSRLGYGRSRLVQFDTPDEAALFLKGRVVTDDLILIKGSRGMRMEFVSENLLFDPTEAGRYLCCQSPEWLARPFTAPEEWRESENDGKMM